MNKLSNIAPLAILVVIISITLAPLSTHGGGIGWHSLRMAKSFALFSTGAWISEFLRNRLNRKRIIAIIVTAVLCILQYLAVEILFYISEGEPYEWRYIAMIAKWIYFTSFILLGMVINASWSKKLVDPCDVEVVAYPFRSPVLTHVRHINNKAFLKNCLMVLICFALYLVLKRFPEKFYYATSEEVRLASRTIAIFPWCGTLIYLYRCCTSNTVISLTNKYPKITQSLTSMLPAAILIMIPMCNLRSIFWWDGLIFYPVCLVVIGFAIRFVVCMYKVLTTKDFGWKYVFLGYK